MNIIYYRKYTKFVNRSFSVRILELYYVSEMKPYPEVLTQNTVYPVLHPMMSVFIPDNMQRQASAEWKPIY